MAKRQLKYVGQSVPRVDGIDKVTGKAKFVGDLSLPGVLQGKILRSTYPHARLVSIDARQAEALIGDIRSGQHRNHAGQGFGLPRVNRYQACVWISATENFALQHSGKA